MILKLKNEYCHRGLKFKIRRHLFAVVGFLAGACGVVGVVAHPGEKPSNKFEAKNHLHLLTVLLIFSHAADKSLGKYKGLTR